MKYLILVTLLVAAETFAITAPESISSETEVEVGSPKDCTVLGKTDDQGDDVDQLALQKQVMDCLGPQEETEPVELKKQKIHEVVSQ